MLRVVREIRPRWVVAENVRGAINLALDTVCAGLEDEGYVVWPFVVPAAAFGAPHRRERLFVVAARADVADACATRLQGGGISDGAFEEERDESDGPTLYGSSVLWPAPRANDSEKRGDIAIDPRNGLPSAVKLWPTPHRNCSNGAGEHGDGGKNIQTAVNGTLNPAWVEILMGFPLGWTDIDCDEPEPWPGWPAMMGEQTLWPTHKAGNDWRQRKVAPSEGNGHGMNLGGQVHGDYPDQYPYEPPRTGRNIPHRAARLRALGNAVVPVQAYPFFEAIKVIEEVEE